MTHRPNTTLCHSAPKGRTFQCCKIIVAKQCCPGAWRTGRHPLRHSRKRVSDRRSQRGAAGVLWTIIWPVSLLAKHSTDAANEARTVFSRLPWAAHIRRQCVLRALRHWAKSFPQNSRQGKGEAASVLDPGPRSRAQHPSLPQSFSARPLRSGA